MHIYISLSRNHIDNTSNFNFSNLSKEELFNKIGLCSFVIIHKEVILVEFQDLLLSFVINLVLNFSEIQNNAALEGRMLTMDADYDYNFKFVKRENEYVISFKTKRSIIIPLIEFEEFVRTTAAYSFFLLEKIYPRIEENNIYSELKNKTFNRCKLPTT